MVENEKDDTIMVIDVEPAFPDKENSDSDDIYVLDALRRAERKYLNATATYEEAKDKTKAKIEKAHLEIKDTWKDLGLSNQTLRDAHAKLQALDEIEAENEARRYLIAEEVNYRHLLRKEKHARLELLVKLLADKKDFLTLMELIR